MIPLLTRRAARMTALVSLLVFVVFWIVSPHHALAQRRKGGKKYALLVGVDRYGKGTLLPGLGDFPRRDVEGMAEALIKEAGYEKDDVVVMTIKAGAEDPDLLPNAEGIRNQLGLILKPLRPADSVIVMLVGHGVMMDIPPLGGGKPVPTSVFCPMDANLAKRDMTKFLPLDEVFAALKACEATTKLLLVDACRNELKVTSPETRAPGIEMPAPPPPPVSVAALYSCSEKEVSWQDSSLGDGHGVFSYYVIEGLKGAADTENGDRNGEVTLDELTGYVRQNVFKFVRVRHATSQMPRLLGDLGLVVLRDRPAAPVVTEVLTSRTSGMKLKRIPAGSFMMGSPDSDKDAQDDEKPQHTVRITRPFYLGVTEVTRGQFRRVVESSGLTTEAERDGKGGYGWNEVKRTFEKDPKYTWKNPGFTQTDEHPVVNVSWNDAIAFCNELSKLDGLKPYYHFDDGERSGGNGYRLPTEAEWEYACRARTTTRYVSGDDPETLVEVGNIADGTAKKKYPEWTWAIAAQDGYMYTAPVGCFKPNGFGLFDMHGNVWEWCWDGYDADYYKGSPGVDPSGRLQAAQRVYRGGGWDDNPRLARSAFRDGDYPGDRSNLLGFRVARVQSGQ